MLHTAVACTVQGIDRLLRYTDHFLCGARAKYPNFAYFAKCKIPDAKCFGGHFAPILFNAKFDSKQNAKGPGHFESKSRTLDIS